MEQLDETVDGTGEKDTKAGQLSGTAERGNGTVGRGLETGTVGRERKLGEVGGAVGWNSRTEHRGS